MSRTHFTETGHPALTLEMIIAFIALLSWPMIFIVHNKKRVQNWFDSRFMPDGKKPTESQFPELSLPLRYEEMRLDRRENRRNDANATPPNKNEAQLDGDKPRTFQAATDGKTAE